MEHVTFRVKGIQECIVQSRKNLFEFGYHEQKHCFIWLMNVMIDVNNKLVSFKYSNQQYLRMNTFHSMPLCLLIVHIHNHLQLSKG